MKSNYDSLKEDIEDNKSMAMLSYITWIVPFVVGRYSPYVTYHAAQGISLFIVTFVFVVLVSLFGPSGWWYWIPIFIWNMVVSIKGISNVRKEIMEPPSWIVGVISEEIHELMKD